MTSTLLLFAEKFGVFAFLTAGALFAYFKLVNQIVPLLLKHNHETAEVIKLLHQILEQLRARPL